MQVKGKPVSVWSDKPGVSLVAAMDTKGQEALYVKACLEEAGTEVFVIDAGIMGESPCPVTVTRQEAARRFPGRPYHIHNAAITVVRTKPGEIATLAGAIAGLCEDAGGPCALLVPLKGFSALDREGGPLHDPEGPSLFLKRFRKTFGGSMTVKTVPCHINDPEFAEETLRTMDELLGKVIS